MYFWSIVVINCRVSDLRRDFSQSKMHCPRRRLPISWAQPPLGASPPIPPPMCNRGTYFKDFKWPSRASIARSLNERAIVKIVWQSLIKSNLLKVLSLFSLFLPSPTSVESIHLLGRADKAFVSQTEQTVLFWLRLLVISSFCEMFIRLNVLLSLPYFSSW